MPSGRWFLFLRIIRAKWRGVMGIWMGQGRSGLFPLSARHSAGHVHERVFLQMESFIPVFLRHRVRICVRCYGASNRRNGMHRFVRCYREYGATEQIATVRNVQHVLPTAPQHLMQKRTRSRCTILAANRSRPVALCNCAAESLCWRCHFVRHPLDGFTR